jgi:septal ring factor EnvC (AmiA/AmiB activator)
MNKQDQETQSIQDPRAEIDKLQAELDLLTDKQKQCNLFVRELMEKEAAGEGPFAKEIHQHKQDSNMLTTQMQHIRVRINRIKLGLGEF